MDEMLEAERFNEELEALLDGREPAGAPEFRADLAVSRRLAGSDLSAEAAARAGMPASLARKAERTFRPSLLDRLTPRPRTLALTGGLATALMAPLAFHLLSDMRETATANLSQGFMAGASAVDGDAAEHGVAGAARGGLSEASMDVVTPLNSREPGTLAFNASKEGSFIVAEGAADREGYDRIVENRWQSPLDAPLSTFSIDVDKASYANARRILGEGRLPPKDAVRVEEFINYFPYSYPDPLDGRPLSISLDHAACPWNDAHSLVRVGLKGRTVPPAAFPPANIVFLVDTSGSMSSVLGLVKQTLTLLAEQMRPADRVAVVAYAGAAGLVLPSTPGRDKADILAALARLQSGGSTAGGEGIRLAYKVARDNFIKGGNNRVVLATDGDFNVGVTSDGELTRLVEEERGRGVFLTVLGFGSGNYQDAKMEKLADTGDGNYAYVDGPAEARKVVVDELGGTLLTLAKDVKVQVEFNPARVAAYRLVGYENRLLKAEDFNDDRKDAGELGSGQTVTALYELIPPGAPVPGAGVDALKYQRTAPTAASAGKELMTVKFRYKDPQDSKSRLVTATLEDGPRPWSSVSSDFRFAAAAAGFAMLLRGSEHAGTLTYSAAERMARESLGEDPRGERAEMAALIGKARLLDSPSLRLKETR